VKTGSARWGAYRLLFKGAAGFLQRCQGNRSGRASLSTPPFLIGPIPQIRWPRGSGQLGCPSPPLALHGPQGPLRPLGLAPHPLDLRSGSRMIAHRSPLRSGVTALLPKGGSGQGSSARPFGPPGRISSSVIYSVRQRSPHCRLSESALSER